MRVYISGKMTGDAHYVQKFARAGNSIVKQVLMALFSQLNIKGVKPWNEVHK